MRPQTSVLVLLLLFGVTLLSHPATAQPGAGGGRGRLKNVNHWHVLGMAEFAVAEHNRQAGQDLKFVRIIRAYVDGTTYRLLIRADDQGKKHSYEAVVWEKLWDKLRELVSFKLLH